jgi:CRP-like cAMP-binding protein
MTADRFDLPPNRMLAALTPGDALRLRSSTRLVSLRQGSVIHDCGDAIDWVYFPHVGTISMLAIMKDGSSVETATIGREGAAGATAGLGLRSTLTRTVVQMPLVASQVPVAALRSAVHASDALHDLVVRWCEVLFAQVQLTGACNARHGVAARFASRVLQAGDQCDDDSIPLTHQILSEMLGVRRSSISEIAGMFQSVGLIRYCRGRIEIVDWDRLEAAACECYETMAENAARIQPADWRDMAMVPTAIGNFGASAGRGQAR